MEDQLSFAVQLVVQSELEKLSGGGTGVRCPPAANISLNIACFLLVNAELGLVFFPFPLADHLYSQRLLHPRRLVL